MSEAASGAAGRGRGGDTRARIQQVALELFAEQGYERTSLREIAERLGVTKAALYYHFKSKDDIVLSFSEDYFAEFDNLIAWAREQPPGPKTRDEIIDRYVSIVQSWTEVFRFIERNQASVRGMEGGKHRFEQFRPRLNALVEMLTGPDADLRARVRATIALVSASFAWMIFTRSDEVSPQDMPDPGELRAIVTELSTDLIRVR
jgi:AcrR family transcriptional regulator